MARFDNSVLVTGGAGFIGAALTRHLVRSGLRVVVLDNLATGRRENLAGVPTDRMRFVEGDIRDRPLLDRLLAGIDAVYHLACLGLRHSLHSPAENHDVNATGTLRLLEAARDAAIGRFVHVSSSEVYGPALDAPMTELHPNYPTTPYGAAKLAGEAQARAFHSAFGLPVVIVRPFNCYGPGSHHEGDSGEVIPRFMLRALAGRPLVVFGDGAQTRDFTYVDDTVAAIAAAGVAAGIVGRTINVGSGREIGILALAQAVQHAAGTTVAIHHEASRPGDVRRLIADSAAARTLLGYAPAVSLENGLTRLRDWYLACGVPPARLLDAEVVHNWRRESESAVVQ